MNRGEQIKTINMSRYDAGIYIVRLIADDEVIGAQKLLILGDNR
jgi:hypothetical protein